MMTDNGKWTKNIEKRNNMTGFLKCCHLTSFMHILRELHC